MRHERLFAIAAACLAVVVACTAPAGAPTFSAPAPTSSASAQPTAMPDSMAPASATDAPAAGASATPGVTEVPTSTQTPTPAGPVFHQPWATATLTDVTSGEQFRIADLAASGQVVFIETMAIWCSNCRAQQQVATAAFQGLDPSKVVWVGLDVEPSETAAALARYRDQNGFPFRYAIADRDVARALAEDFGDVVLSPPSVNLIVLGTDGQLSHSLGHHSAAELAALATENGA